MSKTSLYLCATTESPTREEVKNNSGTVEAYRFLVTVPQRCNFARVWLCGGGGGGAGGGAATYGGGGGGSGVMICNALLAVKPGDLLAVTLGLGGAGGAALSEGGFGAPSTIFTRYRIDWGARVDDYTYAVLLGSTNFTDRILNAAGGAPGYAAGGAAAGRGGWAAHTITQGSCNLYLTSDLPDYGLYDGGAVNYGDNSKAIIIQHADGSSIQCMGGLHGKDTTAATMPGKLGVIPVATGVDASGYATYEMLPFGSISQQFMVQKGVQRYAGLGGRNCYNTSGVGSIGGALSANEYIQGFGGGGGRGGAATQSGLKGGDGACLIVWDYEA